MWLTILFPLLIQQHVPTATVVDDLVTVDAQIAYVEAIPAVGASGGPSPVVAIVQGTQIGAHPHILTSNGGRDPLAWRLRPGTWQIKALGFPPDIRNPLRQAVTLTVTVQPPDRNRMIRQSIEALIVALEEYDAANVAMRALDATAEEIKAAIGGM